MRPDMEKVVTERPRRSGWQGGRDYHDSGARARYKAMNDDDLPNKAPMFDRRVNIESGKEFSDLIQPLYRFFRSNIGKNWDKVWSSICQHLPAKTLSAYHIRKQHLETMIEVDPYYIDGKYYSKKYGWRSRGQLTPFYKNDFYVDKQGCIREGTLDYRSRFKQKKVEPFIKYVKDGIQYDKVNGIWFQSIPYIGKTTQNIGTFKEPVFVEVDVTHYRAKQLNTKELRALGLINNRKAA